MDAILILLILMVAIIAGGTGAWMLWRSGAEATADSDLVPAPAPPRPPAPAPPRPPAPAPAPAPPTPPAPLTSKEWAEITPFKPASPFMFEGRAHPPEDLPRILQNNPGAVPFFSVVGGGLGRSLHMKLLSAFGIADPRARTVRWIRQVDELAGVQLPLFLSSGSAISSQEELREIYLGNERHHMVVSTASAEEAARMQEETDPLVNFVVPGNSGEALLSPAIWEFRSLPVLSDNVGWLLEVRLAERQRRVELVAVPQLVVEVGGSKHPVEDSWGLKQIDFGPGVTVDPDELDAWFNRQEKPIWRTLSGEQLIAELDSSRTPAPAPSAQLSN